MHLTLFLLFYFNSSYKADKIKVKSKSRDSTAPNPLTVIVLKYFTALRKLFLFVLRQKK
jgi:hypothetical protein